VFDASDRDTTDRVVVINQALADTYFSGEDPIGRVIQTGFQGGERIVGVVNNALESSLTKGAEPARYMLYDQMPLPVGQLSFLIRSRNGNELPALVDSAQAVLRDGRHFAVQQATTMDAVFEQAIGPAGQVVRLVSLLAALAVVLGAVGVYGVISHYVSRRSRDYAIRIVLGQGTGSVARQIVGRGAALVAIGGAIGTVIALASMQVLTTLLYNVEPADPRALAQAVALLVGVGIIASAIPAWRTSVANPASVLRQQ
jgi:putative ABC transport system permease protein